MSLARTIPSPALRGKLRGKLRQPSPTHRATRNALNSLKFWTHAGVENFAPAGLVKPSKTGRMHSSDSSQEIKPGPSASPPSHRTSLRPPRPRASLIIAALLLAIAYPASIAASSQPSAPPSLAEPARSWALDCANNEALVVQHPGSYLRYRFHDVTEKGDQLRDQIETPDGSVARLIQRDGRPLTPEEDAAERHARP